jgi:hypothetical protein
MKNADVRVYEEPLSDRKFSWDCQQDLTWEQFERYCDDRFGLDEVGVSDLRWELEIGWAKFLLGRVTECIAEEPVLILGEPQHEVHVHLAICECSDCAVQEDIPSLMALDS